MPVANVFAKLKRANMRVTKMNAACATLLCLCLALPFGLANAQADHGAETSTQDARSSVRYDWSSWTIVKQKTANFRAASGPANVILLKSVNTTGDGGGGQPLNDVNLIIIQGGQLVYEYGKRGAQASKDDPDPTRFFVDDYLELRDVTGDGLPQVLFHTWFPGMSDHLMLEHVLRWKDSDSAFTDIAPEPFSSSGTHGLRWFMFAGRPAVVVADRDWNPETPADERCHYCPSPFQYDVYQWSKRASAFIVYRHLEGEKEYTDAGEALTGDWTMIQGLDR
jgi:hypothetical protein